ncbi:Hypothetical protein SRAE_2000225400 [Strongyloides ratti]|uniref:Uncharacterized protein n=1 Tax=Strongyloides ratti TaxID=34506 RepID=A0A090LCV6_STRRB|nr:Hypothetical protein SRAE_2000225400 [Strongyloides ratti]CEF67592.1 Hypothetical protein SRAE_2000225400 [Strongyloides ratti]
MNEKEIKNNKRSHSIYGGFRATIPHLIIENNGSDYSKDQIDEMYLYINDKNNPISKKREESIADIHIDRVFKRKCMRGVEKFLNIEYQIGTCINSNEIPCKKVKESNSVNDDNSKTNNNNNKNGNCMTKDNTTINSEKLIK